MVVKTTMTEEEMAEWVAEQRQEQGLPVHVEDPTALRKIASLLHGGREPQTEAKIQKGSVMVATLERKDTIAGLELMEVTPAIAANWLSKAHPNRRINPFRVRLIVLALSSGEWQVNGESIKFDEDGLMIDGQHRLQAVIESGATMATYIMRGLPRGSFDTLDIGKPRTAADTLASLGHTQSLALAAAMRQMRVLDKLVATGLYLRGGGEPCFAVIALTPARARVTILEHPDLPDWVSTARDIRRAGIPGGDGFWAGTLYWFASSLPEADDDAIGFAARLISGAALEKDDPILVLRNRLVSLKEAVGQRASPVPVAALVIKSWNAFRRGEKVSILKWSRGGVNKEKFPMPV